MASSTKWRLLCHTASSGGANIAIAELQMRDTIGGSNICSGGTVNASYNNGSYPKENAFDGNASTFWWTAANEQWIEYEFASPVSIVQIVVSARNDAFPNDAPKYAELQYYTGSTYVTLLTFIDQTSWSSGESRVFTFTTYAITGDITESLAITDWRITAIRCDDGTFMGTATSSGTSYSVNMPSNPPCIITIHPKIDYAWSANKVVALNDYCVPVNPETTPRLYKATDIGSSPHQTHTTTEPTWPSSGTVSDGDITWTYIADLVDPKTIGPKIPS